MKVESDEMEFAEGRYLLLLLWCFSGICPNVNVYLFFKSSFRMLFANYEDSLIM